MLITFTNQKYNEPTDKKGSFIFTPLLSPTDRIELTVAVKTRHFPWSHAVNYLGFITIRSSGGGAIFERVEAVHDSNEFGFDIHQPISESPIPLSNRSQIGACRGKIRSLKVPIFRVSTRIPPSGRSRCNRIQPSIKECQMELAMLRKTIKQHSVPKFEIFMGNWGFLKLGN